MAQWILAVLFATAAAVSRPTELSVPICAEAPRIDANLADEAWKETGNYTGFSLLGTERLAGAQTVVWVCRDDAWLYMAFRCDEPSCIGMKRIGTVRDVGAGDDCIEIFLDPGHDGKEYAHLTLTANNVQQDQWCRGKDRNRAWDMPWRSAAQVDPHLDTATGWSAELALPLCVLQDSAGKGPWRINICRSRYATSPVEWTTVAKSKSASNGFHDPSVFLPIRGLTGFEVRRVFGPMLGVASATPFTLEDGTYSYGLNVTVENKTSEPGSVELEVTDLPRVGQPREKVIAVNLGAHQEQSVSVRIPVSIPGPRQARVALREKGANTTLQETAPVGMDRLLPVDAYVGRHYYTSEKSAQVHVEVLLDRAARSAARLELTAELGDDSGKVLASAVKAITGPVVTVNLPISILPAGSYPVRVTMRTADKQELGAVTLKLLKRAPAPPGIHEVKIDRYNRWPASGWSSVLPLGRCWTGCHGAARRGSGGVLPRGSRSVPRGGLQRPTGMAPLCR